MFSLGGEKGGVSFNDFNLTTDVCFKFLRLVILNYLLTNLQQNLKLFDSKSLF